jgi:hypothetical protein
MAIIVGSWLARRPGSSTVVRAGAAVAPLPFALLLYHALMRYVRGLDELEQRKQLEALSNTLAATTIVSLLVGLLQAAKIVPYWGWHGIWIVVVVAYFAGVIMAGRRYR